MSDKAEAKRDQAMSEAKEISSGERVNDAVYYSGNAGVDARLVVVVTKVGFLSIRRSEREEERADSTIDGWLPQLMDFTARTTYAKDPTTSQ